MKLKQLLQVTDLGVLVDVNVKELGDGYGIDSIEGLTAQELLDNEFFQKYKNCDVEYINIIEEFYILVDRKESVLKIELYEEEK